MSLNQGAGCHVRIYFTRGIGFDTFWEFSGTWVLFPLVFTATCFSNVAVATCFSNVAVMGSLDVRLSVCPSVCNVGDS